MGFKERLKEARLINNMTQEQVADLIGVAKSTFTGYEKGNSEPNMLTVSKIMNVLKVDANFLWQDDTDFPMQVSYDEIKHIEKYRALDSHGQETVSYILDRETERVKQIEQAVSTASSPAATRMINYYYRLASAGTGQIIFDMPPTKRIEIPDIPEFRKADYAIGVNGNSMEPTYYDGDTLLVEMTDNIEIGEIGIFSVNNECFVKKLGENELISLNPESNNIPLNETARCMGRVVGKL